MIQIMDQIQNNISNIIPVLNAPFIGGILLIIGAILISEKGDMYYGSIMYLLADVCWIYTSYENGGFNLGTWMVIIGSILGFRTFYKMHKNIYHQNLNIKKD